MIKGLKQSFNLTSYDIDWEWIAIHLKQISDDYPAKKVPVLNYTWQSQNSTHYSWFQISGGVGLNISSNFYSLKSDSNQAKEREDFMEENFVIH